MRFSSESGQSTIEAAILLPVIFVVLGMLLQPGILLYNRCIMNAAASEGCRLVATGTEDDASMRAFMERRLASIPNLGIFHEGGTWELDWSDGGPGAHASMSIVNHVRPLPLFGVAAGLSGSMDSNGCIVQRVEASGSPIPPWADALGYAPSSWIGAWK